MRTTYLKTLTLIFLCISFVSCEKFRCIEGDGKRTTETRNPGAFTGVELSNDCELYITIDTSLTTPEITIEADQNILPYIETSLHAGTLEIGTHDNRCLKTDLPVIVDIYMPVVEYAKLSGSGLIRCDNVSVDNLRLDLPGSGNIEFLSVDCGYIDVNLTGSGKIELTGNAVETSFLLSGSGQIRADQLRQETCYIDLPGSGTIYVWALDELKGTLSGSGVIYFRRPLRNNVEITGSGYMEEL